MMENMTQAIAADTGDAVKAVYAWQARNINRMPAPRVTVSGAPIQNGWEYTRYHMQQLVSAIENDVRGVRNRQLQAAESAYRNGCYKTLLEAWIFA